MSSAPLRALAPALLIGCTAPATAVAQGTFAERWYRGQAEVTSYTLTQARYGELHEGHAVLIFVTEPFSRSKQVKLDDPRRAPGDEVPVLKLNLTKKFNTGIYPYSVMQSVFTPVDLSRHPNTLKLTMSSQEWCGHVFSQLNLQDEGYRLTNLSYFESEGDEVRALPKALLEDELWTRLRIDPKSLPTGAVQLIPSTVNARLVHVAQALEPAAAKLEAKGELSRYSVDYAKLGRALRIDFESAFPHRIVAWEEDSRSGGKTLTTKATKKKELMVDYWTKNRVEDLGLRKALGIE